VIAWIALKTGLSTLTVKLVLCAVGIGAIFFALRLYGNAQWAKGEAQGRLFMARDIEWQKQAEWAKREAEIVAGAAAVEAEKKSIATDRMQLSQDRAALNRTLQSTIASIQQERRRDYANTATVRDTDLDAALRALSRELAAVP
jgi:hypothetical protein